MKSSYRDRYGPPEILSIREVEVPRPKDNDLLIRVRSSTVSRTDCGALWGTPFVFRFFVGLPKPRHAATGADFAGVVEAAGRNVQPFRVGDRVFGFNDHGCGSHAQYLTYPAHGAVAHIPEGIGFADAAASLEGAHYAYNFITRGSVSRGSRVLVYGATGAIGSAAVQLLKHFGAHVTAVCATPYLDRVRALGPNRVVDYLREDFTATDERYDFVFDAVGKSSFGQCRPLLNARGIYVSSELGPGNENLYLPLTTRLRTGPKVVFPIPVDIPRTIALMRRLLAAGEFRPLIDRTYTLDQLPEAFRYVASGQKIGNVLLDPDA